MTSSAFIGVDVSCQFLQISQKNGEQQIDTVLPNTYQSIEQWLQTLAPDTHCVFEATGVYSRKLEYLLSNHGMAFSKINPAKIKGFIHAAGSLAKTDQQDARQIRRYGEMFKPQPDAAMESRQIEQARYRQALTQLEKQLQNIENQIHVLEQEPLPFTDLINSYHTIQYQIQEEKIKVEAKLRDLQSGEEKQIIQRLQSIPGIGPGVATALVAAIGDGKSFLKAKQLAKFLGLAPVEAYSGSSVHRKHGICRTAVPEIRSKLFIAATAAIKYNEPCRKLYESLRAKGKPKKVARVAVMHKMMRQAFAILHSDKPFDPNAK